MRYLRSQPWRSRGPWFGNRAGARRRGRRDDGPSLGPDTLQDGYGYEYRTASEDEDFVVANDTFVAAADVWPNSRRMLAAWVPSDDTLALTLGVPAHVQIPERIDQLVKEVTAVQMLSQQGDESAADSRQSA